MVDASVAGVLFTANPVTGKRHQAVIDASSGLGEAVVSGALSFTTTGTENAASGAYALSTNTFTVRATDNGVPSLTGSRSYGRGARRHQTHAGRR